MTKKERVKKIYELLSSEYPDAKCSLDFADPWQLLVSAILASQCTDKRVNMVTPALFKRFQTVKDCADADVSEMISYVSSTGLGNSKGKNIVACANQIINNFGGEVPREMDELLSLSGVGRKIANLMRGDVFNLPAIVVDTHCKRLSQRIGLTKNTDTAKIEADLLKIVPPEISSHLCHLFVYHGRAVCSARNPACERCVIKEYCPKKTVSAEKKKSE